jgi:hypothetical protein
MEAKNRPDYLNTGTNRDAINNKPSGIRHKVKGISGCARRELADRGSIDSRHVAQYGK